MHRNVITANSVTPNFAYCCMVLIFLAGQGDISLPFVLSLIQITPSVTTLTLLY